MMIINAADAAFVTLITTIYATFMLGLVKWPTTSLFHTDN